MDTMDRAKKASEHRLCTSLCLFPQLITATDPNCLQNWMKLLHVQVQLVSLWDSSAAFIASAAILQTFVVLHNQSLPFGSLPSA